MTIDPSIFYPHNITDTCAVWNVISSKKMYSAVKVSEIVFYCTEYVVYECLHKPRTEDCASDKELIKRLLEIRREGSFCSYSLDIDDLHNIELLQARKKLGLGELSSIAFAIKTRQAFLTDDQAARRLAKNFHSIKAVQTVPHLVAWLFFQGLLFDSDKDILIAEHEAMGRKLSKYFNEAYLEAMRCRLMVGQQNLLENG